MKLTPVGDRLLVKPLPKEEVTKSGLLIPDTAKEKPQEGTVVAVGSGKQYGEKLVAFADFGIKEGVTVLFKKHSFGAEEIKLEGEEHLLLGLEDILAIVSK